MSTFNPIDLNLNNNEVFLDPDAFDLAVRAHGVQLVHYSALKCPIGVIDVDDPTRRPHPDHSGCSNGFLYTKKGIITSLVTGLSKDNRQFDYGLLDGSTVQVTAPRYYDGTTDSITLAPFDRIYLVDTEISVVHWQLVETSITGMDKLSKPVVSVIDIVDSDGNTYAHGDYTVVDGQIKWGSRRPKFDPQRGKGSVYSIRYLFRPFYYISRLVHETRVIRRDDPISGEMRTIKGPLQFVMTREQVFENAQNDDQSQARPFEQKKQAKGPSEGSFGPR